MGRATTFGTSSVMDCVSSWPTFMPDACTGSCNCLGAFPKQKSTSSRKTSTSMSSSEDSTRLGLQAKGHPSRNFTTPLTRLFGKARDMSCDPCTSFGRTRGTGTLGIVRMTAPGDDDEELSREKQGEMTARDHRIQRYRKRLQQAEERYNHEDIEVLPNHGIQVHLPPTNHPDSRTSNSSNPPLESLEVKASTIELARCISELTMRSGDIFASTNVSPDHRRMAFYAVGKSLQNSQGGNRKCYFTGKLILSGAPFYAGCLQQGMRTLVVFCLPSALALPKIDDKDTAVRDRSNQGRLSGIFGSDDKTSNELNPKARLLEKHAALKDQEGIQHRHWSGALATSKSLMSKSRLSNYDDLSMSNDGDLDPNWNLDVDYLLRVLPSPSADLLHQMRLHYPVEFQTLPSPLREPFVWKLYVSFCFFSGLPIYDGELHYMVRKSVADQIWGEPIVLTHEVIEAAHGDTADLIGTPNERTFEYLKKNYAQQCEKLDECVFQRNAWERMAPEV